MFGSSIAPQRRQKGRPRDITKAAEDSLIGNLHPKIIN